MRLTLGLILVMLGLVGAYFVLTGRFPPTQANQTPAQQANPGGGANFGSGGVSFQSQVSHLGIPVTVHSADRRASKGGFARA